MAVTKKDFLKIQTVILVTYAIIILLLVAMPNKEMSSILLLVLPVVSILGVVWFIVKAFKYIKEKAYLSQKLNIQNIGGLMGLLWFVYLGIGSIIVVSSSYSGVCVPLQLWGGNHITSCSLFEFLFSAKDFSAGLSMYIIFICSVPLPILMFTIGFFVDRYVKKKSSRP